MRNRTLAFGALLGAFSCVGCDKEVLSFSSNQSQKSATMGGTTAGSVPSAVDLVSGSSADTYFTEGGYVGANQAGLEVAALVPSQDGGFTTLPGQIADNGTFTIEGVPQGTYYLKASFADPAKFPYYVVSDLRSVDLDHLFMGRPDAQRIIEPTPLRLNLSQMSPWNSFDSLLFFSLGAGASGIFNIAGESPAEGATSLSDYTVDASLFFSPYLVEGKRGDSALITQLVTRSDGDFKYESVGKKLAIDPGALSQADGQSATITGALSDVAQTTVKIDWRRSAFAALIEDASPSAQSSRQDLYFWAEPQGADRTSYSTTSSRRALRENLTTLLSGSTLQTTDATLNLTYGQPFATTWRAYGSATVSYSAELELPDTGQKVQESARIEVSAPLDELVSLPIEPPISPPRSLQINGQSAYPTLSSVGASPRLSWSTPLLGTPAVYKITICKAMAYPANTRIVAQILTRDTSVVVPPDLLEQGAYYYALVSANTKGDLQTPNRFVGSHFARAVSMTGLFSP